VVKAGALFPADVFSRVLKVLLVNMRLAVFPFPSRSQWAGSDLSFEWTTTLAAAFFVFLVVSALKRCPRKAGLGLLWWSIFTLPVLGFFNLGQIVAAERYAYIPSVGLVIIVGGLVSSITGTIPSRKVVKHLALAGILLLGTGAALHTRDLKNEITLFQKVADTNPNFATNYINLGVALAREGRFEEAFQSYDHAAALIPGWSDLAFNRGNLFYRVGKYEEALSDFDSVLKNEPGDWEAALNRGNVLAALGRYDEAARSYRDALAANESSGKPLVALGVLAARDGEFNWALRLFTDAAEREPGLTEAFEGMGESYLALGMHGMAEGSFLRALEISPDNMRAALKLGWFLLGSGRPVQADRAFRAALAVDPSLFEAWVGIIQSLDVRGEKSEADGLIHDLELADPLLAERVVESRNNGHSVPKNR
jgi:tetratricopeptide (TPR) repeat protein